MTTTSPTSASPPTVKVTKDILAHALDEMGLTDSVSASLLYDMILRLQQSPSPLPPTEAGCKITLWTSKAFRNDQSSSGPPYQFDTSRPAPDSDFFDPVRVEKRRKLREEMKEWYPNGIPDPYVLTDAQFRKGLHNS